MWLRKVSPATVPAHPGLRPSLSNRPPMTPLDLLAHARSLAPALTAIRRDLHRHPELGFQEHRTAGVVEAHLRALGLAPRTGVGRTGVVVDIVGGEGPTVAVRADMDALPIHEDADHDYRSTTTRTRPAFSGRPNF